MNTFEESIKWLENYPDRTEIESPTIYKEEYRINLQFNGWELVLCNDGTYYLNDTSGG